MTFVNHLTFLTISKEVQFNGLSINKTLPSKKGVSAGGMGFLAYQSTKPCLLKKE